LPGGDAPVSVGAMRRASWLQQSTCVPDEINPSSRTVATMVWMHMTEDDIWGLEERFWLDGLSFYESHLDPECLMAFPGMGVMGAGEILKSLRDAPRWASVDMADRAVGRPVDTLMVVGYRATGYREGASPYQVFCTSTYRSDGVDWKLVQHQQTPSG